jgi:hypothetical protein
MIFYEYNNFSIVFGLRVDEELVSASDAATFACVSRTGGGTTGTEEKFGPLFQLHHLEVGSCFPRMSSRDHRLAQVMGAEAAMVSALHTVGASFWFV